MTVMSSSMVMVNKFTFKVHPAASPWLGRTHHPLQIRRRPLDRSTRISFSLSTAPSAHSLVHPFDPRIPIEEAVTPPSSWYTDPSFLDLELDRVFHRGWQVAGRTDQLKSPQDFFTGRLGKVEYVVCRGDDGTVRAFHNVCRHHASLLASGSGSKSCFVCPYHGWTYALNGALLKATRIKGIRNFDVKDFGLKPLKVATWGPFVLLKLDDDVSADLQVNSDTAAHEWIGSCLDTLSAVCLKSSLHFLCRREYIIECNWKVFCDNYLDGGYHVPYAHKGLASGLKLDSYTTMLHDKVSLQRCEGGPVDGDNDFDRLGEKATYAFIYPNFMINRYGPWMDTNLVLPLRSRKCLVIFDYFLEGTLQDDHTFIDRSLQDSERVQTEDIVLCEGVQRGLESPAYCSGRYAPTVENAMHHFHCLLHRDLTSLVTLTHYQPLKKLKRLTESNVTDGVILGEGILDAVSCSPRGELARRYSLPLKRSPPMVLIVFC